MIHPYGPVFGDYMVNTAQNEEHDDEDISLVGPNSPEIILGQMEELQENIQGLNFN